jgi:hypothetical protein
MREHPIPQDIVGYRFHIVGSMTLKQFAELALGAILGLIIYATNLPPAIKWPLIFVAAALGAAAAFLPIEERPLDHWITTFFQTLYKPTKFFWKKTSKVPDAFLFKVGEGVMEKKDDVDLTPIRRKRIKEYLASTKSISNYHDDDTDTQNRIGEIMKAFGEVTPDKIEVVKQIEKPDLKVRTRSLKQIPHVEEEVVVYEKTDQLENKTILSATQVAQKVGVPVTEITNAKVQSTTTQEEESLSNQQQAAYATSSDTTADQENGNSAVFNASLPFPSKPTTPNKLVGMILTANSELIPEAIIEIKDEQNRVVRAVKSNALGQFFISTPLKKGNYNVIITHPKYQFNSQEVVLKNELVEPIEVRSLT